MNDRPVHDVGYNERLFSGGLRRAYHMARFRWLEATCRRLRIQSPSVIELGCFDGRALDHVPAPRRYVGLDANWEGGLQTAMAERSGSGVEFIESITPETLDRFKEGEFDLAISLETLEHIPPEILPAYIEQLARITHGHFLVTVPTELGPVFLAKYLAKLAYYGGTDEYSAKEVVAATFGRTSQVKRQEHKGFDYRVLVGQLEQYFDIERVEGVPAIGLPPLLSLTVGIVARSKQPS